MKLLRFIVILLTVVALSQCTEEEVLKDASRIKENNGLMIKHDSSYKILENANIIASHSLESIIYEGKTIQSYQLTIEGEELNEIKPGTIVVDNTGQGKVYMIKGLLSGGKSSESKSSQILDFIGIDISLDFLFNYEGAKLIFSSPENRTKRNSTINGKIYTNELNDDPTRFQSDENGKAEKWNGYTSSSNSDLINMNFSSTLIGLKPTTGSGSLNLTIGGFIRMNIGLDFLMEYNQYYLRTSDLSLTSYIGSILNMSPYELFGKTAITLGTMKKLKAIAYTELDYGLNFGLSYKQGIADGTLFRQKLARYINVYPAGPVPVSQVSELYLEINLKTTGEVDATYKYQTENDIVLGFDLNRQGLTDNNITWYREVNSKSKSQGTVVVELEITTGIKLVFKTEVYVAGILGPQAQAYGYLEGGLDSWIATSGDGWKIYADAGLSGNASADLSLFHFDKATWKFFKSNDIDFLKYNIYTCPYSLRVLNGNNQSGPIGQKLQNEIQVQVLDKWNIPIGTNVPNVWVYFDGKNNPNFNGSVPQTRVSTVNGIAATEWTLDNTVGSQKLLAYLKDTDGSILENTATINAIATDNTFTDSRDGHKYKWVQIGNQIWMAENLAYLPAVGPYSLESSTTPYYHVYDYFGTNVNEAKSSNNYKSYGVLYNWTASMNVCPSGWHLPSDNEWKFLEMFIGMSQTDVDQTDARGTIEGGKLKEVGFSHWLSPNSGAEYDQYNFTALPGGARYNGTPAEGQSPFGDLQNIAYFWTSTDETNMQNYIYGPWIRALLSNRSFIMRYADYKQNGFSVRCIKN